MSREIRRNIHEPPGNYRPRTAQRSAERRRSRHRNGKIASNSELREFVREQLKQRWSPRQISNRLRTDFMSSVSEAGRGLFNIAHELT